MIAGDQSTMTIIDQSVMIAGDQSTMIVMSVIKHQ
jgi:hypothetical protein